LVQKIQVEVHGLQARARISSLQEPIVPLPRIAIAALTGLLVQACAGIAAGATAPDFVQDIKPILAASCVKCHGAEKQKGGLRLDAKALAMKGGTTGVAIKPGDSKGSYLMARLRGEGDETRMPDKGEALTAAQIAAVAAWIDAGAAWPDDGATAQAAIARHWAYEKPRRPPLPAVRQAAWVRTPIDAFVLARLEKEGLAPSPPAERTVLIRRASLDLTGLPPTPEEVDAFVADAAPDAYERLVDRLLASPHYGERWARLWLDLARYADTDGFEFDSPRTMWPYRDWVIGAFNADMPFDRFTIEQLAGDLLPGATQQQRVATGFHRNTMKNSEGGVDPEEARWETLLDRTNTTAEVWLGSTFGCAQCHNHKYDPIKQRDYYALLAFFDNSDEPTLRLGGKTIGPDGKEQPLTALVVAEKAGGKPQTNLRIRGAYVNKGEVVPAATPSFLPPLKADEPLNRLGLARWLVDADQPLTARVTVNRIWETYFGKGLVETSDDFGSQGTPPSHPELLDWLAVEFSSGWSLKKLHRLIVTSATYRQSSHVDRALAERDPYNRLLARAPRYRLEAELLRDNALAIAGLLSPAVGGPSVFPLGPSETGRVNTNKENLRWTVSAGPDRYRRGLYTFWRRTSPYPTFATFDAPSREFCTLRRTRTNTPLQALSGLNDPAFWEAAQALGRRIAASPGAGPRDRLAYGFRLCAAHTPGAADLGRLEKAFAAERAAFAADAAAMKTVCGGPDASPELAASIMLANVLLNLDETITRE
jgi:mono/diheme cytochrome c family protein